LRSWAQAILPRITQAGDCVAVIGSVARGNARADSELDLWIIGKRSGRIVRRIDGVSVTLLCQQPVEARAFENLCYFEVDELVVLEDGAGEFEKVQTLWRKQRRRVKAEIIRATNAQLDFEFSRAEAGSAGHRATFLRLAAWRLMCLRLFIDTGWRVPRLHLLQEELPKALWRRLDEVLALPSAAKTRAAVALLPGALKEVAKFGGPDDYRLPEALVEKVTLAPDEAAFIARKELVYELLPRVFGAYGITDLRGVELLGTVAPKTKRAFELLEPKSDERAVKKLRAHLSVLRRSI
jgi:predicted nucleotidyltransferase